MRPYIAGEIDDTFAFKIEGDFAGSGAKLIDAYVQFRKIPYVGNITVGHIKEPFGLERLTSAASITFLERSLANALVPPRAWGAMVNNQAMDNRMTWAVGLFRNTDDKCSGNEGMGNAYAITGRVTFLPMYEEKGRRLLHVGLGYSLRHPDEPVRFRSRPEARFVDFLTSTGNVDADSVQLFSAEAAWVHGPLSIQGEYMGALVDAKSGGNLCMNGFYVQGSYLLTGEHRPYNRAMGIFSGIRPKKNFLEDGGWGAWEIAARYSYLDLADSDLPVTARRMQDITLGVNWYLNPNVRIGWNYIRSQVDGSDTSAAANIALMRIQIAF